MVGPWVRTVDGGLWTTEPSDRRRGDVPKREAVEPPVPQPSDDRAVHEAPAPPLARLEGPHHRVSGRGVVRGRVASHRGVAAAHVPAGQAEPQLDRMRAVRQALGTGVGQRRRFGARQFGRWGHSLMMARLRRGTDERAGGGMDALQLVGLVAASAAIAGAARRTPVPAPLLLVAAGLAASYVPGVPDYTLDPHIVLPLILPRSSTRPPSTPPTSTCGPTSGPSPCSPSGTSSSPPWPSAGSRTSSCPTCRSPPPSCSAR